jgi:hypothetical protein
MAHGADVGEESASGNRDGPMSPAGKPLVALGGISFGTPALDRWATSGQRAGSFRQSQGNMPATGGQLPGNNLAAEWQLNGNIRATFGNWRATGPAASCLFLLIFFTTWAPFPIWAVGVPSRRTNLIAYCNLYANCQSPAMGFAHFIAIDLHLLLPVEASSSSPLRAADAGRRDRRARRALGRERPRDRRGASGSDLTDRSIIDHCRALVADYKRSALRKAHLPASSMASQATV